MATMEAIVTGHPDGWAFASATAGIVNTTTAVTLKAAVIAPTCNYVASLQVAHDAPGGTTELAIRDGAGGAVLWRHKLQAAANENMTFNFDVPLRGSPGNLLEVVTLTAVTGGVYVNCQGFAAP